MVIARHKQHGAIMVEMIAAIAILVFAVLPLAFGVIYNAKQLRVTYQKSVALQIADGEMEILVAGEWRNIAEGTHPYTVHANAAKNLAPGKWEVTRTATSLRLQWRGLHNSGVGPIVREVTIK